MTTTNIPNPQTLIGQIVDFYGQYHRTSPDKVVKGYYQEDFQKNWARHLPQPCGTAAPGCGDGSPVAAELQNPSTGISGQQPIARRPQLIGSCVAADLQSPSPGNSGQQPVDSSPRLIRSDVAAELENASPGNSGQQPVARSPKLIGSGVAAELQNPSPRIPGQQPIGSDVAAELTKSTNNEAADPARSIVAAKAQTPINRNLWPVDESGPLYY